MADQIPNPPSSNGTEARPATPDDAAPASENGSPETARSTPSRPWLAPLIACGVATLALGILLLPGVLSYFDTPVVARTNESDLAAQRATNQALEQRIALVRAVLENAQCRAPEGLVLPDGGLPPMPGYPNGLPSTVAPGSLLPPIPDRSMVVPPTRQSPGSSSGAGGGAPSGDPAAPDQGSAAGQPQRLPEILDASTVMVIAIGNNGEASSGTGVVIAPGRVLTNRHVIDVVAGDPNAKVLLTSQTLGQVVPASIVVASSVDQKPLDLAVLESPGIGDLVALPLSGSIDRMGDVIAAGYPGAVLQFDEEFQRLKAGDASAAPNLVITSGIVTVIQNADTKPIIGHTAAILSGNSGGPLVDFCGRVLGINTFGPKDVQTIGYAQSAQMARKFLSDAGIQVNWSDSRCEPIAATTPVVAAPGSAATDERPGGETAPAGAAPPSAAGGTATTPPSASPATSTTQ